MVESCGATRQTLPERSRWRLVLVEHTRRFARDGHLFVGGHPSSGSGRPGPVLAILFLALTFDFVAALGVHYDSRAMRFLDTRIYPSRFLNAVLLGQNYHLIHHLWTTIPWYRPYQRVFRAIRPELEARGSRVGWTVEPLTVLARPEITE